MPPTEQRPPSRRDAANAAALAVIFNNATLDELQAVGESLLSQGLTAHQLDMVMHGLLPFVPVDGQRRPPVAVVEPADEPRSETQKLREWALSQIEEATGTRPVRGRGQSYALADGRKLHLRTMRPFDRGEGRTSYWFGLHVDLWGPDDVFALACGTAGLVVVPATAWEQYRAQLPSAKNGTELQPNIWLVDGRFELRSDGDHIDISEWVDNLEPLKAG